MSIYLLFLHYLSDWILQPRYIAENKSSNNFVLLIHCSIIFICFFLGLIFIIPIKHLFIVCLLNSLLHFIIDKYVWSLYKYINRSKSKDFIKYNLYAKDYWFYFTIAIDSLLHITIILLLFK